MSVYELCIFQRKNLPPNTHAEDDKSTPNQPFKLLSVVSIFC